MQKRPSMFTILMILLFTSAWVQASIPPHPRVRQMMKEGRVTEPYYLRNLNELRSRGVNAPWMSEGLRVQRSQALRPPARVHGPALVPTGAYHALVILVDFSDQVAQVATTEFDTLIFSDTPGTMRDYFNVISYGNLDVVTVNLPSALGWTRADSAYSYYTSDAIGTGHNGLGDYPRNVQKLVEETVHALDATIDYTQYDNDGDGYVDALFVVHSGPGAEYTGSDYDIWSHAWVTYTEQVMNDGAIIWRYSTEPEYWLTPGDMTIGVYAHEMGHAVFGVPDLYDRDYSSEGLGDWTLMAGGSWNGVLGDSPAFPDAWTATQMGYVTATNVTASASDQAIVATETTPTAYRLWTNGSLGDEYFLVENRQQLSYDAALPGEGLLIYHVDETAASQNDDEWYPEYTEYGNYLVALEQADGLWELEQGLDGGDSGDPFPGNTNNTVFGSTSFPNSNSYADLATYVGVGDIHASGDTVYADFVVTTYLSAIPDSLDADLVSGDSVSQVLTVTNEGSDTVSVSVTSRARTAVPVSAMPPASSSSRAALMTLESAPQTSSHPAAADAAQVSAFPALITGDADILILSTTTVDLSVLAVLEDLGHGYVHISTSDFTTIDFSPYSTIIVAMDGGYVYEPSLAAVAAAAASGKNLILIGGSYLADFAYGVNLHLVTINYSSFSWVTSAAPHIIVTDSNHPLATDLPNGYTFSNYDASYYMLRLAGDPAVTVAAENGDGYPILFSKPIGAGQLIVFANSPHYSYWYDATDWQVLRTVLRNALSYSRVDWLSFDVPGNTIAPGESMNITTWFKSAGMMGGDYDALIQIDGTNAVAQQLQVPAHMHVTGIPDIVVEPDTLDFGGQYVGMRDSLSIFVGNAGTDSLVISGLAILPDDGLFSHNGTAPMVLYPGENAEITVYFASNTNGPVAATLSIASNDPDETAKELHLSGSGMLAPTIAVEPEMLYAKLEKGDEATLTFTIDNSTGLGELEWYAEPADALTELAIVVDSPVFTGSSPAAVKSEPAKISPRPSVAELYVGENHSVDSPVASPVLQESAVPLDSILARLNRNYAEITSRIPYRFDFADGVTGTYISDGNYDMYDGGNYLQTDLGGPIPYSDNWVSIHAAVGDSGKYFTRKHPGLFVFAADLDGVDYFEIGGNLGADGDGSANGFVADLMIGDVWYTVFVKRVYETWDPSVNHMVIVENASGVSHEFATGTDSDYHRVTGLRDAKRIYYLLYAGYDNYAPDNESVYIDNQATGIILSAFLEAVGLTPPWMTIEPSFGSVAAGSSVEVDVHLTAIRPPGVYEEGIVIFSNDPVNPLVMLPLTTEIPLLAAPALVGVMDIPGDQGGWVDVTWLPSRDDRATSQNPVLFYSLWQKAAPDAMVKPLLVSLPDGFESTRISLSAPGWMGLGSVGATQDSLYSFLAHTLADSNQHGVNLSYFRVSAHTALAPSEYVYSEVVSGYSVDNIAPGIPTELVASSAQNGIRIDWKYDVEAEADFQYFAVYRGETDTFLPEHPDSVFATTEETFILDEDVSAQVVHYYRVAAVDHNGNLSELTEAIASSYLSVDGSAGVPETFALRQNYPNPFNPRTVIRFDVPEASHLSLAVYDILGREVVQLVDGYIEPGYHQSVWNGRSNSGREMPTGVYIARLITPNQTQQIKMVLMK